jgi:hypothetical protein
MANSPRDDSDEPRPRRRKKRKQPEPNNGRKIALMAGGGLLALGGVIALVALASHKKAAPVEEVASTDPAPVTPAPAKEKPKPQPVANASPPPDNQLTSTTTTAAKPAPNTPSNELSADARERTRRATVHVDVHQGSMHNTSSGLVANVSGDTVIVVTSYHAFLAGGQSTSPTGVRQAGKPGRPPAPARPPNLQHYAPHLPHHNQTPNKPKPPEHVVHVSFYPGTPQEQKLPGTLVAFDDEGDLAALKVAGVRSPPTLLLQAEDSTLSETMPVHLFGYSQSAKNVGVSSGKVSQVRRDDLNEIDEIQVNGPMDQHTTGGPVVNSQGKLVGIARGAVSGKNFGFVIPFAQIDHMLRGSIVGGLLLGHIKQQGNQVTFNGEVWRYDRENRVHKHGFFELPEVSTVKITFPATEFQLVVLVADPLHKIKSASLLCAPSGGTPPRQEDGKWAPLSNPLKTPLVLAEKAASAILKFPAGTKLDQEYAFQVFYVNSDGQTVYLEPHLVKLTLPKY